MASIKLNKGTTKGQSALDSFNIDNKVGIGDFIIDRDTQAPVANRASNVLMAAQLTALSNNGQNIADQYRSLVNEASISGQSHTATSLHSDLVDKNREAIQGYVSQILQDPTVPDPVKIDTVKNYSDSNSPLYNTSNMLSSSAVSAPTLQTSPENEQTRISIGSTLAKVNQVKQEKQQIVARTLSLRDDSMFDKVSNFFSGMVPGVTEARQANIAANFYGDGAKGSTEETASGLLNSATSALVPFAGVGKAIASKLGVNVAPMNTNVAFFKNLMTGQSKAGIQTYLNGLSPEEQVKKTQQLADIIINNPSPLSGSPNYAANREALQEAVSNGGYSSVQQFTDNTMALLDAAGMVPATELTKGAVGAYRASKVAGEASKAKGAFELASNLGDLNKSVDALDSIVKKTASNAQFHKETEAAVNAWKAAEPAPLSDLEAGIGGSVNDWNAAPSARRSADEIDQAKAIADWKKAKPTPTDMEADLARQVKNFTRRKGPKPSSMEDDMAAAIEAHNAKQVESNVERDTIKSEVQPTSVSQNYKDMNIDAGRVSFTSVAQDASDETAEALYGTTRNDALANDLLPEIGHSDGSVNAKVPFPDGHLTSINPPPLPAGMASPIPDASILPEGIGFAARKEALNWYDKREIAAVSSWKVNKLGEAMQAAERPEMFQVHALGENIDNTSRGFKISGVYGPIDHGYSSASDALDVARFTLRDSGIPDKDFSLLKRVNDEYIPTTLADEVGVTDGDYLIKVDHEYKVNSTDYKKAIDETAEGQVHSDLVGSRNNLMSVAVSSGKHGTFIDHILSQGSRSNTTVYKAALSTTDTNSFIEKVLTKDIASFAKPFSKLPVERKKLLEKIIYDANRNSLDYDFVALKAAGLTDHEASILKQFKRVNDVQWVMENHLYGAHLREKGYSEFIHTASGTREPVKVIKQRGAIDNGVRVLDTTTGTPRMMKPAEIDQLYKDGGQLGSMLHPHVTPTGDVATHVVIGKTASEGYTRAMIPGQTQVLAHRPGYFKTNYTDPHIIMKKEFDPISGKELKESAVATGKTTEDANAWVKRLSSSDPDNQYYVRSANERRMDGGSDDYDAAVSQGRSAWRRRGKQLETSDTTGAPIPGNIQNPVEALTRNARSLANKTSFNDAINAMATRIGKQYGDFLEHENGRVLIPESIQDVKYRGEGVDQRPKGFGQTRLDDARNAVNYLNYLKRNSYGNLLDQGTKAGMRLLADSFGAHELSMAENMFNGLSNMSLSSLGKKTTYTLFLATAPLRQIIVQASQISMLAAINPKWMASGMSPQMMYMMFRTVGMEADHPLAKMMAKGFGKHADQADDVWKDFEMAGISAAIDHNNMVNGIVQDMAKRMVNRSNTTSMVKRGFSNVLHGARTVGFDAGEWASSTGSWLAHRDLAVQLGKDAFDPRELANISAHARNYTGAMNHAGDMPQNQNALSVLAQFTQMTQKMVENLTFNKVISKTADESLYGGIKGNIKMRQTALMLGLFGLPSAAVFNKFTDAALSKALPDDPNDPRHANVKKNLDQGLEGFSLNYILSKSLDQKVDMDFSGSFNPFNVQGTTQLLHGIFTSDAGSVIARTPAGSLLWGNNPRIGNFLGTAARFAHLKDDFADPTTFSMVAKDAGNMFSGMSSYFKMKYGLEYSKKMSGTGRITDNSVSPAEAYMFLFGIQTNDEKNQFDVQKAMSDNSHDIQADVQEYFKQWDRHARLKTDNLSQMDYVMQGLSEFHRVYGDNPQKTELFDKELKRRVAQGDSSVYESFLRASGLYPTMGEMDQLIDQHPFESNEDREQLRQTINNLRTPSMEK